MTKAKLIEILDEAFLWLRKDSNHTDLVKFDEPYGQYYMITDDDGFICLCSQLEGYLIKVNPKCSFDKAVKLFYQMITEESVVK